MSPHANRFPGRPPSASSSRVTPSRSAISKACSRFSRLLWICTLSMSTRSGLQDTRRSHNGGKQRKVSRGSPGGHRSEPLSLSKAGGFPRGPGLQQLPSSSPLEGGVQAVKKTPPCSSGTSPLCPACQAGTTSSA